MLDRRTSRCFCLRDGQDEGVAGSTAGAAQIARGPARSVDGHAGGSRAGDQGGCDCDLQLLTAQDLRAERRPVDDHDGRRNQVTAIHREKKALLHLSEGDRAFRERRNGRSRPGASAQGIECIAALEDQHSEQQRADRPQRSVNSFHTASYTRVRGPELARRTEVTPGPAGQSRPAFSAV